MNIEWTVSIGDILTLTTIAVSVVALIASWSKDREARQKERADRVRNAIAVALIKLDRWRTLQLSLFSKLQPIFIETSEILAKDFNLILARDFLWKQIANERTSIQAKLQEEQIESAYVGLFSHFPAIGSVFLDTLTHLRAVEEEVHDSLLQGAQADVFACEGKSENYSTAALGNALRHTAQYISADFQTRISGTTDKVQKLLFELIAMSNMEILTVGLARPLIPDSLGTDKQGDKSDHSAVETIDKSQTTTPDGRLSPLRESKKKTNRNVVNKGEREGPGSHMRDGSL